LCLEERVGFAIVIVLKLSIDELKRILFFFFVVVVEVVIAMAFHGHYKDLVTRILWIWESHLDSEMLGLISPIIS
jgi:hypothetical protein